MKTRHFILALLLACSVGTVIATRGDFASYKNRNSGAEFRIDSGAVIQQTGTTSANALGPTTVTGALGATARVSGVGLSNSGTGIDTPEAVTIGAGTTTTPTSAFALFSSTGGAITSSATPFLATTTAVNGQSYEIMSSTTSDLILGDNGSVTGSLIELHQNITSRTLANPGDLIRFRYYAGKWYEVAFSTH